VEYPKFKAMNLPFNQRLESACREKSNSLCIGLDINPDQFPEEADRSLAGMEAFGKDVIEATIEFCPVYKPNVAFFERFGSKGYELLEKLVDHIAGRAIVIADAKRGDIGNTSRQYAKAILETMGCDAITLSPYMGRDAIEPFIMNSEKGVFVLALTSNPGAGDLQMLETNSGRVYEHIIKMTLELNTNENAGLVVGATQAEFLEEIRAISPGLPWLIPGVGTQGGNLENALRISNQNGVGIVNISRGILYAGNGSLEAVVHAAQKYTHQIRELLWTPVNC
jgi:orotidine-5'-phosphate decarboxylase